ncbi:hypothetical protein P153DRAFT_398091 [Dothidotthia symphoricarpi CBS 119687]|uniref:Amine oxidase domain-containing protein n=1 Tax=Dothidotthia symphoricarpi CBS 119687 TaxID=1392245 RepID=A0A6A6ABI9_9PLEO|nr:uncharacterized protein P153DRAFT_398091 [Dothidotthia symphoricarpi CBS 119687]KAF2128248.1 hypothetical protein P153DRAFT_398091 [Dothidotthia symphoricarpi CBS 119687]
MVESEASIFFSVLALRIPTGAGRTLEQSALLQETGAAISIAPNASLVLRSWGFDPAKSRMVAIKTGSILNGSSMQMVVPNYYANVEEEYSFPIYSERTYQGSLDNLSPFSDHVHWDTVNAKVTLAYGTIWRADLVIAAHDVHSTAREYVLATDESHVSDTGWATRRWLLPTEELLTDPNTASLIEDSTQRYFVGARDGGLVSDFAEPWIKMLENYETSTNFIGFFLSICIVPSHHNKAEGNCHNCNTFLIC